MKSYNHLWEEFISDENIEKSIKKASIGKKNRKNVQRYLDQPNIKDIVKDYAEHYHNSFHSPVEIYDGIVRKKRNIIVPTFAELIIQHMIVNVLQPIFMKGMYEHSYGSIPGRGAHKGKKTLQKWIAKGGCKYCLKMDIRKYFRECPA